MNFAEMRKPYTVKTIMNEIINNPDKYFPEEDSTGLKNDFIDRIKILKEGEQIIFDELL